MGLVYADVELINAAEKVMAKRHLIGDDEVNSIRLNMLVDSGAYMMAINETICQQLNLTLATASVPLVAA
jgi:predicted aspartyl protease